MKKNENNEERGIMAAMKKIWLMKIIMKKPMAENEEEMTNKWNNNIMANLAF